MTFSSRFRSVVQPVQNVAVQVDHYGLGMAGRRLEIPPVGVHALKTAIKTTK
jgi:hypothetical protein